MMLPLTFLFTQQLLMLAVPGSVVNAGNAVDGPQPQFLFPLMPYSRVWDGASTLHAGISTNRQDI